MAQPKKVIVVPRQASAITIKSVTLDKTEYEPGETVKATVTVSNPTDKDFSGKVKIVRKIRQLLGGEKEEKLAEKDISVPAGKEGSVELSFKAHTDIYPTPKYYAVLLDAAGKEIDRKEFDVKVKFNIAKSTIFGLPIWLIALLVAAVVFTLMFKKRR